MTVKTTCHTLFVALALLGCLGALALGALGGCSDQRKTTTPLLSAEPAAFVFPKLQPGEQLRRRVALTNQGGAELILRNIRLVDRSNDREFSLSFEDADGNSGPVPSVVRVPVQGPVPSLIVEYTPSDMDPSVLDEGEVRLESNDPNKLEAVIPIVAGGQGAELVVTPNPIQFTQVEAGGSATESVLLANQGQTDLLISELYVSGSANFRLVRDGQPVPRTFGGTPLVVRPDEAVELEVVYTPPNLGRDGGQLVVISNNTQFERVEVEITAQGIAPCINVSPGALDFGAALLVPGRDGETPNRRTLIVESCGETELRVDRIEFDGPAFGFLRPLEGEAPVLRLPARVPGEEAPSEFLQVGFWPTQEQAYGGRLLLYTNAEVEPVVVELFGRGVANACPIPDVTVDTFDVRPLDIIDLDGSPSTDPGGRVERWEWTVVDRPVGSVSQIVERFGDPRAPAEGGEPDDESTPQARFFVDLAGSYVIELRVYDNLGQVSCDPFAVKRVIVQAVPDRDLHVQLVWSTPDDPDETDQIGTDVDLHLRHERAMGRWGSAAGIWDCYFRNKTPDWGVPGDFSDDPSLDIDDTNGAGPENINLSNPEVGVAYDVGAVYFRAESTFGVAGNDPRTQHPSYVSVRLYVRGDVLYEAIDRELTATSQLWHVARIRWCEDGPACPVIEEVDQVLGADEWFQP